MTAAPATIDELCKVVASSTPGAMRIAGAGTKRRGAGDDGVAVLELRQLTGIVSYTPAECVLTARAGTPVAAIEAALAEHAQYLPFDPTHVRAGSTLGGTVAAGLNGAGRYRYGGVRDFVIGARVVDGYGRLIASGGQVVKNAAGFLTHHALVGSAGTLGAIAEVTIKVFPRPEARATLSAPCPSFAGALAAHERLRAVPMDVAALDIALDATGAAATVWVRLAGAAEALPARIARAQHLLESVVEVQTGDDDARVWSEAAELTWTSAAAALVKVPTTPGRVADVVRALSPLGICRVQCGGAVTVLATSQPLAAVDAVLTAHGWRGVAVCGPASGRRLGPATSDGFGDRVRRALDPDRRFR
ncbi:MAG: FAD-binding protein [Acidobacteriota bacterium]